MTKFPGRGKGLLNCEGMLSKKWRGMLVMRNLRRAACLVYSETYKYWTHWD